LNQPAISFVLNKLHKCSNQYIVFRLFYLRSEPSFWTCLLLVHSIASKRMRIQSGCHQLWPLLHSV